MRAVIRWAIENSPAMNILMLSILVVGAVSLSMLRREIFPEFELEIILVTVPYPGATPAEVEEGICQKIEEAVRSISGVKRQVAVAQENAGFMVLYLEANVNVQRVLSEVRAEIDRIPSFPDLAEDPEVQQLTFRLPAIRVGLIGPDDVSIEAELELRQMTETLRSELLQLPSVSQAELINVNDFQIDIEIPEQTLRKHGLTLQQVAQIVRRENIELPGGTLNTESQEVLLRGKNKRVTGEEIARIPLLTTPGGVMLTVGDLGFVRDEFEDTTATNRVDGLPAMVIGINRTSSEDLLAIAREVKEYVADKRTRLPPGYSLRTWQDASIDVKDRLDMLTRNGLQGLLLVFVVLAVFLELKLAFWVALGIPVALLGSGVVLLGFDQTLNMLSMFAFLLVLGIVVDDAIVVGENIYVHRARHESLVRAAIDGTREVLPAVATSVTTTIIAFIPLFFVSGVMGKFIAVMPLAVIAMLAISLIESTLILPCHLAHRDNLFLRVMGVVLYPVRSLGTLLRNVNRVTHHAVHHFTAHRYLPMLGWCLNHPPLVFSIALALLIATAGMVRAGITPWILFPKLDNRTIEAKIAYPDGTPSEVTDRATRRLEDAIRRIDQRYAQQGQGLVRIVHRSVGEISGAGSLGPDSRNKGGHLGAVYVELVEPSERDVISEAILQQWREEAGDFSGVERLTFGSPEMGPGGRPIEFKLLAPVDHMDQLEAAVAMTRRYLAGQRERGVFDIRDDSSPGKWEYQLRIKQNAIAMGISAADLAETVRAAFYGEEVMRLQRGRHEVKLMVRYPRDQRRSLSDFEAIRVRTDDGAERPLTELAEISVQRGYAEINRVDQMRSITITADVDEKKGNASRIVRGMQNDFIPGMLEEFPEVRVRWEGQREESRESMASLYVGFLLAVFAMYCLLTLQFRSYFQPFIILTIIPFGFVGAVWGHALLGLPLTMLSMFGMVALTGVVVNDSIVLVDFINKRMRRGVPIRTALLEAGSLRFRPVMLTTITTIAGLTPLLLETSFQAQVIVPMAASLCFGLMAATGLVLLVVPTLYLVYVQLFAPKVFDINVDEYEIPVGAAEEAAMARTAKAVGILLAGLAMGMASGATATAVAADPTDAPVHRERTTDVCIVGGGSGGVAAAIAAAREGAQVILVERQSRLGGTGTNAFVSSWEPGPGCSIAEELYERMKAIGGAGVARSRPVQTKAPMGLLLVSENEDEDYALTLVRALPEDPQRRRVPYCVPYQPEAFDTVVWQALEETGNATVMDGCTFFRAEANAAGTRVQSILVRDHQDRIIRIRARVFVDATGDIWLARDLGCEVMLGIDPRSLFDEPSAPETGSLQLNAITRCYRIEPSEQPERAVPPADQVPFPRAAFVTGWEQGTRMVNMMPTLPGRALIDLGYEQCLVETEPIVQAHWHWLQQIPEFQHYELREIAPMLGIRESYRLMARYVLTEHDLRAGLPGQQHPDIIAVADHPCDVHGAGGHLIEVPTAYGVPYRCLIPAGSWENLLVACRGAGFSRIAASSVRLQRTMIQLGHAAGIAAAWAARENQAVDRIDVPLLVQRLDAKSRYPLHRSFVIP